MKFNVGYQMSDDFVNYIIEQKDHIGEVYFAFGDFPNGRKSMNNVSDTLYPWETGEKQIKDLKKFASNGISLDLLLNGMCYGRNAQSRAFFEKIGGTVDYLKNEFGLSVVTTTSPLIAKFIKNNFSSVTVRASVNMEIGTVDGMRYVADLFDSFYMKRECNRDESKIKELTDWCRDNGKELLLLANSGCLNNCSAHTFHDNLVSHESEIAVMDNAYQFEGICRTYLSDRENLMRYLSQTNFIRPEDVKLYEPYFASAKLATRVNRVPIRVLRAYIEERYIGSVTDLLEPDHSGVISPYIIENSKIPDDFASNVLKCSKNCRDCPYCHDVLANALVSLKDAFYIGESSEMEEKQC